MKFVLKPSLEHMALVKIAICFWNQNDVTLKFNYAKLDENEWKKIEEKVIEKVPELLLPQLLKEKLLGVIKPIGIQIFEWMRYYRKYDTVIEFLYREIDFSAHLTDDIFAHLCWTPVGTVDRKRTAEVLVRDEKLNVSRRYILACDYFLENDIIRFWNRLPQNFKDYHWSNFLIIRFWSNNMKKGVCSFSYKDVFYSSLSDSNKVAAKYFLQQLTPQEREESIEELVEHIKDADVLCFLLSEMKKEEQIKVLTNEPRRVLQFFLQWPWQTFFVRIANCLWDFLSKDYYDEILVDIIHKVEDGCKDYNYRNLFREFWQESPNALKNSVIEEIDEGHALGFLLKIKDRENIRLILKDVTLTAKEKLIHNNKIEDYLLVSIHAFRDNECDFLQFFIQECFSSKNEMLNFKEEFEKRKNFTKWCSVSVKHKWNQLFCFSDDFICKYGKRSPEDGESSSSKRFQNLQ